MAQTTQADRDSALAKDIRRGLTGVHKEVAQILHNLAKTARSFGFYAKDNRAIAMFSEELHAGFDSFIAAGQVGPEGRVVGIDMTEEMLAKSRATAADMGLDHVEFREGLLEEMPVEDGWADVLISNGVINLCADKRHVFSEIMRILKPGGRLQFADIANGQPVPEEAIRNIDLWTA